MPRGERLRELDDLRPVPCQAGILGDEGGEERFQGRLRAAPAGGSREQDLATEGGARDVVDDRTRQLGDDVTRIAAVRGILTPLGTTGRWQ